jgi:RimJ/RimL family protein N-acetyltransferase
MAGRRRDPKTSDLLLRYVRKGDLPIFFEHQSDPAANQMAAFPARERQAFTTHWNRILGDGTIDKRTILFGGQVAGYLVSFERFGLREVGYWIGKSFWGRGVASGALLRFLGEVPARPLYARVARHNVASLRVLEKCGFTACEEDPGDAHAPVDEVEEVLLRLDA